MNIKRIRIWGWLPIWIAISLGCGGNPTDDQMLFNKKDRIDDVAQIHQAIKDVQQGTAILLDVRTDKEWQAGHFAGAVHVPIDVILAADNDAEQIEGIDKSKKVYVHCAKGVRAAKGARKLDSLGYDVVPLKVTFEKIHQEGFEFAE